MTPTQISDLLSDEKLNEYRKKIPQGVSHEQLIIKAYNDREGSLGYVDCPRCKNKGTIAVPAPDANGGYVVKDCGCMKKRRLFENLSRSGLQGLYERYRFETFEPEEDWQQEMLCKCQAYIQDILSGKNYWLYFGGQRGCGKSHLCVATAGRLIAHGESVMYKLWKEIASEYKALTYKYEEQSRFMQSIRQQDILYIDDLLKVREKNDLNHNFDLAFTVLNSRYNQKNPTIISCEYLIKELAQEDSAISGRIIEMTGGGKYVINIPHDPEKDMRLKHDE